MASIKQPVTPEKISINSQETALCIILPPEQCGDIGRLRELYDKAYGKWPAHINLIYPFVPPESLPRAHQQLQDFLSLESGPGETQTITLSETGMFKHRNNSTVFLQESRGQNDSCIASLRLRALQALGQQPTPSNMHLTIGQTDDNTLFSQQFLLGKAQLLPKLNIQIGALAILIRDRTTESAGAHPMKLWGVIELPHSEDVWKPSTPEHWISKLQSNSLHPSLEKNSFTESDEATIPAHDRNIQSGPTYYYHPQDDKWTICQESEQTDGTVHGVTVSSYNVLIDSEYPPTRDRDGFLVQTILANAASADILVLQEVSDDFLTHLLSDLEVRRRYPYTSHGPPHQSDIGPLPSMRNIVVLSRWCFNWTQVPFHRKHKGALVANFGKGLLPGDQNLVVAGVHLTAGLTDGSVAAKKVQLQTLMSHLAQKHENDVWMIAGDFNLATSSYTIGTALKDNLITAETVTALSVIETSFSDAGLDDAWTVAHVEAADEVVPNTYEELFDGEEGATFDPRNNILAAESSGTSSGRPQRYDRILVRAHDALRIVRCNNFGLPEDVDGAQVVASDHSGVRASLEVLETIAANKNELAESMLQTKVERKRAVEPLRSLPDLDHALAAGGMLPTEEAKQQRKLALSTLEKVILGTGGDEAATSDIPMVIVPVGSYALGVWTVESDIDCLCIGTISSKTFFKLARQRLIKAQDQGVRVLRKVEASTGTMLELSVNGVAMDLQYCPAARVVERWSEFKNLPASDPIFNLSILSLRKLKPYRDLLYIQRTLPSLPAFRLAYRCIKLWAVQRGLYSAKFGYLGGVHITLMLSWVTKCVAHDFGSVTAPDLVTSFFHHFAHFDWTGDMMYDAFFHRQKPRYHRSAREPMVILGFHAPNSNIAHTSTLPGLNGLVSEMKAADEALSDASITWEKFFGGLTSVAMTMDNGASEFLTAHSSYIKIDIQFWGRTLAKGKSLVGWVESRCLSLVVDIHKTLADAEVRIWPARFTDNAATDGGDYHGCYLIGLSRTAEAAALKTQEEKLNARQALQKILDRFLTQLKTDERNYDSNTCWIDVSLAKAGDVKRLCLDGREWGDYVAELEPDSDDEEDVDDFSDELAEPIKRTIPQRPKPTTAPLSASKLRPASDVLHRLRWDPNLDPANYIIGYEDRFLGARETGLEKWKTEQTDEEFIPQHRILYFKNKEGEVVWERVTRIDKVFGSGVGTGEA
ncbi:hypothetical protein DE146DRAFT_125998 [Phaeosphaeria sp. MPI-PUGE-AT-0046c]|nr:hypothetical protein DE146DRAFT_125998 [Phaeosphaeria sp. MPI-PUGE-AT-0046c]